MGRGFIQLLSRRTLLAGLLLACTGALVHAQDKTSAPAPAPSPTVLAPAGKLTVYAWHALPLTCEYVAPMAWADQRLTPAQAASHGP